MINYFVKFFRGNDVNLSNDIPTSYLLMLTIKYLFRYVRGILYSRSLRVFIGKRSSIRCVSKMFYSGFVNIGENTTIDALSKNGIIFGKNISIGNDVSIICSGSLSNLGYGINIEDGVGIGSGSFIGGAGGVSIGRNCILGNYVTIHPENHIFNDINVDIKYQGVERKGIVIGANCWIGAKATILDGTVIGDGCVVAAGAVLNGKEYPHNSIIAGVPAKVIRAIK